MRKLRPIHVSFFRYFFTYFISYEILKSGGRYILNPKKRADFTAKENRFSEI